MDCSFRRSFAFPLAHKTLNQGVWITVRTQPYYARVDFSDPSLIRGSCLLYRIDVLSVHAGLCDNFYFCVQGESRKPTDFLSRNKPCRNVRRVAYHVEPKALD